MSKSKMEAPVTQEGTPAGGGLKKGFLLGKNSGAKKKKNASTTTPRATTKNSTSNTPTTGLYRDNDPSAVDELIRDMIMKIHSVGLFVFCEDLSYLFPNFGLYFYFV